MKHVYEGEPTSDVNQLEGAYDIDGERIDLGIVLEPIRHERVEVIDEADGSDWSYTRKHYGRVRLTVEQLEGNDE